MERKKGGKKERKKEGKKERKKEGKKEGKKKGRERERKEERKKNFKVKSHICSCNQHMACVYGNQGMRLPGLNSDSL